MVADHPWRCTWVRQESWAAARPGGVADAINAVTGLVWRRPGWS